MTLFYRNINKPVLLLLYMYVYDDLVWSMCIYLINPSSTDIMWLQELHTHDTDMWNRHQKLETLRNWFRYKIFYYLWVKGNSTCGERGTIFLCWLFHLPPTMFGTQPQTTGLVSASPKSQPSSSEARTQLLLFLKSPNHQPTLPVCDVTHIIPIWDFYFDISEWCILSMHVWTPALMLYLTNPCTKQKVLILTKPKGKIYKTKSFRHYITQGQFLSGVQS